MPNFKVHLIPAVMIIVCLWIFYDIGFYKSIIYSSILIFYSLLPDIDIGNSKVGKPARGLLAIASLGFIVIGYVMKKQDYFYIGVGVLVILVLLLLVKHRTFFHTMYAGIILSLPLLFLGFSEMLLGVSAYFIHLLLDGKIIKKINI